MENRVVLENRKSKKSI